MRASAIFFAHGSLFSPAAGASLGAYIREGLGLTTTTTESSSTPTPSAEATYANSTTFGNTFGAQNTSLEGSLSQWQTCAESWSSYESIQDADVTFITTTYTTVSGQTANVTYGTGDVYTTLGGIPVVSGNFTPTKVVRTVIDITTTSSTWNVVTKNDPRTTETPACSSISPSECSLLYESYLHSLGLPSNASVPSITPAPTNSPACPAYYYKAWSSCTHYRDSGTDLGTCYVEGANVQLFFFPPRTVNGTAAPNATVVQSYAPGITFTSPSIYMSFDYLSASSGVAAMEWACSQCGSLSNGWGCEASAVGGGNGKQIKGTSTAGALLSLAPAEVSTLLIDYPEGAASSYASAIANGLPNAVHDQFGRISGKLKTQRLDLDALVHPAITDYFLNPRGAPGCNYSFPTPECSTMFEGEYRPILSLPAQVSLLQGAWKGCVPAIYGVYDPPLALTEGSTLDGPSTPGQKSSTTTAPMPSSYQALPASNPTTTTPLATNGPGTYAPAQPPSTASSYQSSALSSPLPTTSPTIDGSDPAASSDGSPIDSSNPNAVLSSYGADTIVVPSTASTGITVEPQLPPTTTDALSVLQSAAGSADLAGQNGNATPMPADAAGATGADPANVETGPGSSAMPGGPTTALIVSDQAFTVHAVSDGIVVNSVTISTNDPGLTAAESLFATVSGQRISIASDGIRIADSSIAIPPLLQNTEPVGTTVSGAVLTMASSTVTAVLDPTASGVVVIDGPVSLTAGEPASMVNGMLLSATEGGIIAGGSFVPASGISSLNYEVVSGAHITASSGTFAFELDSTAGNIAIVEGSVSLTVGGPARTLSGVAVSAAQGGIVVDGSFVSATAMSTSVGSAASDRNSATTTASNAGPSTSRLPMSTNVAATTSSAQRLEHSNALLMGIAISLLGLAIFR
ncbi:hypothetical protein LTR56_002379 [Elasticomyces elasticus]|nr:hypothetical protein LTR56_002379 [Elasticomyces elasticus]KAK3665943.1 hypothetical protein LTR22_003262 [Elasticomyces elasticus]KAK4929415.1 hypothetical protein LTR49_004019 [Elasticomyces elasticus]KAK5764704.1 hypothetical protein LTS12_005205 [Elasticomyces elasticus]